MAVQFDNRVSWMDIVAISGFVLTGMIVFFGVSADVKTNAQEIIYVKEDMKRVEAEADKKDEEILEQLKEQRQEIKDYRAESRENNKEVVNKLDRLIERELNNGQN